MGNQNTPKDERWLTRRLAELEQRIKTLETAPRAGHTSVSGGRFEIRSGGTLRIWNEENTEVVAEIGELGSGVSRGFKLNRPTGEPAVSVFDSNLANGQPGFVGIYDAGGNYVLSDDVESGEGLATPYLAGPGWAPGNTALWPQTTSAGFVAQWHSWWIKQHPRIEVTALAAASDATTAGEIRLVLNGTQAAVQAVPVGGAPTLTFTATLPGAWQSRYLVRLEARRTAGSGTIGVYPMATLGVAS